MSKYIGKDEESLIAVREQLARRSQIEEIIKKLKEEKAQIKKLEAMLWFYTTVVIWCGKAETYRTEQISRLRIWFLYDNQ